MSASAMRLQAAAGLEFMARPRSMGLNRPVIRKSRLTVTPTDRRGRGFADLP
jgi:hypothetical protein